MGQRGIDGAALVAAMILSATTAHAQNLSAIETLRLGVRALRAEHVDEAIELIVRAESMGAGPLATYNLGLAYQHAARPHEALRAWRRYLDAPEARCPASRLAAVRAEVTALEAQSEAPAPATPPETPAPVAPPPVAQPTVAPTSFIPAPIVPVGVITTHFVPPPALRATTRRAIPAWTWVAVGVGALGLSTAAGFGIDGALRAADFDARCGPNGRPECAREGDSLQLRLDAYSTAIAVASVLGAVGIAATAVGLWIGRRPTAAAQVAFGLRGLELRW